MDLPQGMQEMKLQIAGVDLMKALRTVVKRLEDLGQFLAATRLGLQPDLLQQDFSHLGTDF
jgi:hypothetical protein